MEVKKKSKDLPIGGVLPGGTSTKTKTGNWKTQKPVWDKKRCIQCMMCYNACPEDCIIAIKMKKGIKRSETDLEYCKGCGICAEVCPVKCITMVDVDDDD